MINEIPEIEQNYRTNYYDNNGKNIVDKRSLIKAKLQQLKNQLSLELTDDEYNALKEYNDSLSIIKPASSTKNQYPTIEQYKGKFYKLLAVWGTGYGDNVDSATDQNSLQYMFDILSNSAYKSPWNRYMSSNEPTVLRDYANGRFVRFYCKYKETSSPYNEFCTDGLQLKNQYWVSKGKFECEVRFHLGKTAWPAIWCTIQIPNSSSKENYFEIDLLEYYYGLGRGFNTTYHNTKSYNTPGILNAGYVHSGGNNGYWDNWDDKKWTRLTCTWDADNICCYVNNELILKIDNNGDCKEFPIYNEQRKMKWILGMQYNYNRGGSANDYYKVGTDGILDKTLYYNDEQPDIDELIINEYDAGAETPGENQVFQTGIWMDVRAITISELID